MNTSTPYSSHSSLKKCLLHSDALRSHCENKTALHCGSNFQGGVLKPPDKRGKRDTRNPYSLSAHCSHAFKCCYLKQDCKAGNNGCRSHLCSCKHTDRLTGQALGKQKLNPFCLNPGRLKEKQVKNCFFIPSTDY